MRSRRQFPAPQAIALAEDELSRFGSAARHVYNLLAKIHRPFITSIKTGTRKAQSSAGRPLNLRNEQALKSDQLVETVTRSPTARLVPLKVAAYKTLWRIQRMIGALIRSLPGAWSLLDLPTGRIRSLRFWIERRRKATDWWTRPMGPYFESILPSQRVARTRPKSVVETRIHPLINIELDRVHNETFLARIPRARILGPTGVVITPDGQIVEESTWGAKWLNQDRAVTSWKLPRCENRSGIFYTICSYSHEGYYHWMSEVLPRLMARDELTIDTMIIVPANLSRWQSESLSLMGITSDQTISLDREYLDLETLYFPSYVGEPGNPHARAIEWLRAKLLPAGAGEAKTRRRLYITRRLAARRRVVNEDELAPILNDYGFEIIEAENLTVKEQIDLFSQAEAVVSLHGAGLTNMIFADSGCKVLEIYDPEHLFVHYYALADVMKHDYWYLIGQPAGATAAHGATGHQDIRISPDDFARSLDAMFERQEISI